MSPHMGLQIGFLCKFLITVWAHIWFLPSVGQYMMLQWTGRAECCIALFACKWTNTFMSSHVNFQVWLLGKSFATLGAYKGFFTCVCPDVGFQMAWHDESSTTFAPVAPIFPFLHCFFICFRLLHVFSFFILYRKMQLNLEYYSECGIIRKHFILTENSLLNDFWRQLSQIHATKVFRCISIIIYHILILKFCYQSNIYQNWFTNLAEL